MAEGFPDDVEVFADFSEACQRDCSPFAKLDLLRQGVDLIFDQNSQLQSGEIFVSCPGRLDDSEQTCRFDSNVHGFLYDDEGRSAEFHILWMLEGDESDIQAA